MRESTVSSLYAGGCRDLGRDEEKSKLLRGGMSKPRSSAHWSRTVHAARVQSGWRRYARTASRGAGPPLPRAAHRLRVRQRMRPTVQAAQDRVVTLESSLQQVKARSSPRLQQRGGVVLTSRVLHFAGAAANRHRLHHLSAVRRPSRRPAPGRARLFAHELAPFGLLPVRQY